MIVLKTETVDSPYMTANISRQMEAFMDTSLFQSSIVQSNRILYTPSVFAKTNLLHLQEIGQLDSLRPHTSQRSNMTSYLFFLVKKGSGILVYDDVTYSLSQGDCVFIDCRKKHSHRSSEQLWTLQWAHFYGPNMNGIYEKYVERGGIPCFHPEDCSAYEKLLTQLFETASSGIYVRDMKICEHLTCLLTLLMEESWNHRSASRQSLSRKRDVMGVKEYLDQHFADKITLDQLSDLFYINKFYLTRVFKEQLGMTVQNYLTALRITHAKQLLRFSDYSIDKIGQQCGMNDANYFDRMFRKIEGMSPGEFRKMWVQGKD